MEQDSTFVRAAVYRRVSSPDQAAEDKISLDYQLEMAKQYAKKQGWQVTLDFTEPGISGEVFEERPALQEMLKAARAKRFDVLIVQNGDRLARRFDLYAMIVQTVENESGIPIMDLSNPQPVDPLEFNPSQDESRLFSHGLRGMLAQADQRQRVRRIKMGMENSAKLGKFLPTHPPYGYRSVYRTDPATGKPFRTYEVIEEQFEILREIKRLLLDHSYTINGIVTWLQKNEIPSALGAPGTWRTPTLRQIVANPFYGGKIGYRQMVSDSQTHTRVRNPKPETIIYAEHNFPTPWEWADHLALLEALRVKAELFSRSKSPYSRNPLGGVLCCGYCRVSMSFSINKRKHEKYTKSPTSTFRCRLRMMNKTMCVVNYNNPGEVLAGIVSRIDQEVEQMRLNPEEYVRKIYSEKHFDQVEFIERKEEETIKELAKFEKRRKNARKLLLDEEWSLAEYRQELADMDEEEARLRHTLTRLAEEKRVAIVKREKTTRRQELFNEWPRYREEIFQPVQYWEQAKVESIRLYFQQLFKKIYVKSGSKELEFEWRV
jgi:DNA invertase Pin-like site-specific DNA recombinase